MSAMLAMVGQLAPARVDRARVDRPNPWNLTPKQQEVLDAIADGGSNEDVARRVGCTGGTVEQHAVGIYKRMGLSAVRGSMCCRVKAAVMWALWREQSQN